MPLQLWADVYNAAGVRQGAGPITTISQASIKRVLDNAGTITFSTPITDERALTLLTVRARVRLFIDDGDGGRELTRGMILERKIQESASGRSMQFTCVDNLGILRDKNTLLARMYSQESIEDVIDDLLTLASGWSSSAEAAPGAQLIDARFDGANVLKALQQITKITGYHFRLGTGDVVEFGAFGDMTDTYLLNAAHISEIANTPNVGVIDSISVEDAGEDIVNTVIPLGAGTDAAALKLKKSTRTTPYPIQNATGPSGKKYWYIQDDASVDAYGEIVKVVTIPEIAPISNTAADKVNAANQLYDAAAAWLTRAKELKKTYKVTAQNIQNTLYPGDKINIRYKGIAYRDGVELDYLDLNDDFWILSVNETVSPTGRAVSITISNTDTEPKSAVGKMIEVMESVEVQKLKPITNVNRYGLNFQYDLGVGQNAIATFLVTNATLDLQRVLMKFKTSDAEYHNHVMLQDGGPATAPAVGDWRLGLALDNTNSFVNTKIINPSNGTLYTGYANNVIASGIYPAFIGVLVDGVDRTSALGGPWNTTGVAVDIEVEINASWLETNLYSRHTIEFYCTNLNGRIEIQLDIYEILQGIAVDN